LPKGNGERMRTMTDDVPPEGGLVAERQIEHGDEARRGRDHG
jgi:hypothetical protein